jgi:hypothetical protein
LSFPFFPDGGDKVGLIFVFYGFFKELLMLVVGLALAFPYF